MKSLLVILVALTLAVFTALLVLKDPGYVLITIKPWSIELSLFLFLILLAITFVAFYLLIRMLVRLWTSPRNVRDWQQRHRTAKAHAAQTQGMMELIEGEWQRAERRLISHVGETDTPVLNYLGAAQAAQGRGDIERRDLYLTRAQEGETKQTIAVGLSQARLQYQAGQLEQALATLIRLRAHSPKNRRILELTLKVCEDLRDWDTLREVIPAARKYLVAPADDLERMEVGALQQLLAQAPDADRLNEIWKTLNRTQKGNAEVIVAYANRLIALDRVDECEDMLRRAIAHDWQPQLVRLYGRVRSSDVARQLKTAEKWAVDHKDDPDLLLTLAQLSLHNELWGKARAYLEASIAHGGTVEAYRELGHLLEKLNEPTEALSYYRDGLDHAAPEPGQIAVLPAATERTDSPESGRNK